MIKRKMIQKMIGMSCVLPIVMASFGMTAPTPSYSASSPILKVGDKFTVSGINLGKNAYVTQVINKDLTGDSTKDLLYVVGIKQDPQYDFYDQFTYVFKNGKTGKTTAHPLKSLEGYAGWGNAPAVELQDLNSDAVPDVFFSSYSGGTGGFVYYNISTFKDGKFKYLIGQKELIGLSIQGKYLDGFKAELTCVELSKTWNHDLSAIKSRLIEMGVYNADGKLLVAVEPWAGPLVGVKVNDGFVTGTQSIKGMYNQDYIGALHVGYTFGNGKLTLQELTVEMILKGFN